MTGAASSPATADGRADTAAQRSILVLGMHRSGTSAVTRCLNLLGVDLGKQLLPPAEGNNPKGFWENAEAVAIDEQLLERLGRTWFDGRPLPDNWLKSGAAIAAGRRVAQLLKDDFDGSRTWALKDPRLCRLVPLWREVLTAQGVDVSALLVVRHPHEVALSLHSRDRLPLDLVYLSWMQHFAEAEAGTRGLPRSLVSYEALLVDWRAELIRAANGLGFEWPTSVDAAAEAIGAFLDESYRHHVVRRAPQSIPTVVMDLYRACRAVRSANPDWTGVSNLVDSYHHLAPVFLARAEHLLQRVDESSQREAQLANIASASRVAIEGIAADLGAATGRSDKERDQATLYYRDDGSDFMEANTCRQTFEWDLAGTANLHFDLPGDQRPAAFRIDPSNGAGAFHMRTVRLNGSVIEDLRDRIGLAHQHILDHQGADGVWFASADGDPWIEVDVSGLTAGGGTFVLDIECTRRSLQDVMGAWVASVSMAQERSMRRDEQENVAMLRAISTTVDTAVEAGKAREADLRQRLDAQAEAGKAREAELRQQLDAAQAATATIEAQVEAGKARENALSERLTLVTARESMLLSSGASLAGEAVKLREECATMQHANASLTQRSEDLARRYSNAQHQLEQTRQAQQQLAQIHSSTLWRALVMMRSVLLRMPSWMRRLVRRSCKALWWMITPWKLPRRLAFIRQRDARAADESASKRDGA